VCRRIAVFRFLVERLSWFLPLIVIFSSFFRCGGCFLVLAFASYGTTKQQPYFFSQDPDYITVKERVAALCAKGTEPKDVATIDIAVEALRVAEYLTPTIQEQLK